MGQKIHAISLRLQKTNRFYQSAWFTKLYYTHFFHRDFYWKKIGKNFICEGKYLRPRIYGSYGKRKSDLFVFFLTKKKQFKKFQFRFRSRKKITGSSVFLRKNSIEKIFPGKGNISYKKFKNIGLFWDTKRILKDCNIKKQNLKEYLLNRIQSEKLY